MRRLLMKMGYEEDSSKTSTGLFSSRKTKKKNSALDIMHLNHSMAEDRLDTRFEFPFILYNQERGKLEMMHTSLKSMLDYFEGPNYSDLSFDWINKDENIHLLSRTLFFNKGNAKYVFRRDYSCEFKLIKLLTETPQHQEQLIPLPKSLKVLKYQDVLPFGYNNVPIFNNENPSNYELNFFGGSYISGPFSNEKNFFVVAQGPIPIGVSRLWKMIEDKKITLIIMLCRCEEDSRKKCEQYWPNKNEKSLIDDFELFLQSEDEILPDGVILREIILKNMKDGTSRSIIQLQVLCWSDFSVPENSLGIPSLEIVINYIDEYKRKSVDSPILVHCSGGVGRSGTMIAIYNIIKCLEKVKSINKSREFNPIPAFFSVFNVVRKLREQRIGMVSTECQYKYIYDFCIDWVKSNFNLLN